MLAPRLTSETADELIAAAAHKSKSEIAQLLAERFPRPDVPAVIRPSMEVVEKPATQPMELASPQHAPGHVESPADRPKVKPLVPERFAVQFTIGQRDHELLRYVQELLSHQIPSGNVGEVFVRALRAMVPQLEKAKFAATDRPRQPRKPGNTNRRYIPAQVRRAVRERDCGRCTFVGDNGHRYEARKRLEFDHVREFARGGRATTDNVRLRCRAHNQYTAEQTYGAELMDAKRADARHAAEEKRARAAAAAAKEEAAREHAKQRAEEVLPWLQALGIRADHARQAAQRCESMPNASLEERVKAALSYFAPRDVTLSRAAPA
jgi:5-methylcytosine-specific restriction endonuclease McrA